MATQTKTRKVALEGRGNLTLRPDDYVTSGGEGAIYRTGDTIMKIYSDPDKMRRDGMIDKIRALGALKHEFIVAPQGLVTEPSGEPIGYYMPFVNGEPMSRVFTNAFRTREKFTDELATMLAARMHDTVKFAHQANAIMVDANELNWLVALSNKQGPSPRAIDVDSWVLNGKIPATIAKMPSIRDWHTKLVSVESDWFAWGIVTFQLFTGVHPYKGSLDGYDPKQFIERMKANKSVFTPGVRLNKAVRDFSCIPGALLGWYEATFQNGERSMPPSPLQAGTAIPSAARVMRVVTTATGSLVFDKLYGMVGNPVLRVWPCGVVLLSDGSLVELGMKKTIGKVTSHDVEVTKADGGWLISTFDLGIPTFTYASSATGKSEPLDCLLKGYGIFRAANRMFVVTDRGITEVSVSVFGKPILSLSNTWGALLNSTQWFDGVGVQDALGAAFMVLPFGDKACAILKTPELDKLKVVTAKAGPRFAVLSTVNRSGDYERLEFTFDRDYQSYTLVRSSADDPDLHVAILPKGVAASIRTDGELHIIVPTAGKVSTVADKHIATDMMLGNVDDRVVYIQHGELWSVKMR